MLVGWPLIVLLTSLFYSFGVVWLLVWLPFYDEFFVGSVVIVCLWPCVCYLLLLA